MHFFLTIGTDRSLHAYCKAKEVLVGSPLRIFPRSVCRREVLKSLGEDPERHQVRRLERPKRHQVGAPYRGKRHRDEEDHNATFLFCTTPILDPTICHPLPVSTIVPLLSPQIIPGTFLSSCIHTPLPVEGHKMLFNSDAQW